ncbi:MAG: UDP-N-acetylmuramoyl-L-alanyl-D-glutamate--2,6-diaminopimelate ligase, partial [Methylococcales bacterium]|nr:UDP-N-acetylmuramoyl-L-alanyl-D-glutamate--2,6-diaminopimelate ligase [Methylococcales bacterium]
FICVPDLSRFLGELAHQFFNQPSRDLIMVGITGTNGKTSCTQCIAHAISQTQACGMIGTLGVGMYPEPDRATMTTPDPISVHRAISSMLAKRAAAVVMEVSSHALDQNRVQSVDFDIAVLTNISRDHLDYHGDMAHYIAAKKRLFQVASLSTVVVNLDDPEAEGFVQEAGDNVKVISFGLKPNTASHHINIDDVQLTESGIEFAVHSAWGDASIVCALFGEFNIMNIVASLAVLLAMDLPFNDAVSRLQTCPTVAGRLELITASQKPKVFVDYAHTPDALMQSLTTLRAHFSQKIWCVFGCGGDRDQGKRPLMGGIAEQYADQVVLTDDNPRHESSSDIIDQIQSGISPDSTVTIMPNRAEAIAWVIESADNNDVVLVAGKGHEDYQIVGDQVNPFSDRDVVRKAL